MSIFKHETTNKCLTFGDFGTSFNNNFITLQECPDGIERSNFGDSKSNLYKISSNGQCVIPNAENNKLILGNCNNNNSKFSIYHTPNNLEKNKKIKEIKAYIVFNGGRDNIYINNLISTWQKKLTNSSHKNTYKNINSYFVLYNFDSNETFENLYRNNGSTNCNLKLIIDENSDDGKSKSTTYYLTPNKDKSGLVFSEYEYTNEKLVIITESRIKNDNNFNNENFGVIKIGFNGKYANINHRETQFIMPLKDNASSSSLFRILFIDNTDNFKILYDSKNNTKLYSYVNPIKKITYNKKNKLISNNLNNKSDYFNFNIIEGMNTGQPETDETRYLEIPTDINSIILSINQLIHGKTTNFDRILKGIDKLKKIMEKSSDGNANAHTQEQQTMIKSLYKIIDNTQSSYKLIKHIHKEYETNSINLNKDNLASIQIGSTINESYNSIKNNLDKINPKVKHYNNNKPFKISDFILNPEYLNLLASIFNYLNTNQNTIKTKTIEIYHYLPEVEPIFMNELPKVTSYNNMINSENILNYSKRKINEYINNLTSKNYDKYLIKINFSNIHEKVLKYLKYMNQKIKNQLRIIEHVKKFELYEISNLDQFNSNSFPSISEKITDLNSESFSGLITNLYNKYSLSAKIPGSFSDNISNTFNSLNDGNYIPQKFKFLYESFNLEEVSEPRNLYEYYSKNFLINYKQKEMIKNFKIFYEPIYNRAIDMLTNKNKIGTRAINTKSSNQNIEGFSNRKTGYDSMLLPRTPKYLNQCQYANTRHAFNLIQNGFTYNGEDLNNYISISYDSYDIGSDPYKCDSVIKPDIGITYNALDRADNYLKSEINNSYLSDACELVDADSSSVCDFWSGFKLDVKPGPSGYVYLRTERLDSSKNVIRGSRHDLDLNAAFGIPIPGGSVNDYEKIFNEADISGKHVFFTRVTSKKTGDVNYYNTFTAGNQFQLLQQTSDPTNPHLNHHDALYSGNKNDEKDKFRLIIDGTQNGGTLTLQYILKNNKKFSGSEYKYGIGKSDANEPIVSLYGLKDISQNKVGATIDKIGYLSVNNKYKDYTNESENIIKANSNLGYKTYTRYNIAQEHRNDSIKTEQDCIVDPSCVAFDANNDKGIMIDKRKYIHKSLDAAHTIKLKKFGLDLSGSEIFMNDSSNNGYLTDASGFKLLENNTGLLQLPTIENILKPNYDNLTSQMSLMTDKYENLVDSFNKLTTDELVMLKNAGISVTEIKELVNRYSSINNRINDKIKLKDLFDTQKEDSSQLYNRSEYAMALTGIASIASLMYVFNYMKK